VLKILKQTPENRSRQYLTSEAEWGWESGRRQTALFHTIPVRANAVRGQCDRPLLLWPPVAYTAISWWLSL